MHQAHLWISCIIDWNIYSIEKWSLLRDESAHVFIISIIKNIHDKANEIEMIL